MANLKTFSKLSFRFFVCKSWPKSSFQQCKKVSVFSKNFTQHINEEENKSQRLEVSLPTVSNIHSQLANTEVTEDAQKAVYLIKDASDIETIKWIIEKVSLTSYSSFLICQKLGSILKNRNDSLFRDQVSQFITTPEYKKLLFSLEKGMHMLHYTKLVTTLRFCVEYKVPSNSMLVKKLLTLILDNINKFSSIYTASIYTQLKKLDCNDKELVEALKAACIASLNIYLEEKRDLGLPYKILFFMSEESVAKNLNINCLNILKKSDLKLFSPTSYMFAMKLFVTQNPNCKTEPPIIKTFLEHLKKCLNDTWSVQLIERTLRWYQKGLGKLFSYDEELCDKFVIHALKAERHTAMRLLKLLCQCYHLNTVLLCELLRSGLEFESLNDNDKHYSFYDMLIIMERTGEKYISKDFLDYYITQIDSLELNSKNAVTLALVWASLTLNKEEKIDKINQICEILETNFENFSENNSKTLLFKILVVYQWLLVFHPRHVEKFPIQLYEPCFKNIFSTYNYLKCKESIRDIFGGEKYLLENCTSSLKQNFSYVVLLDSENKPIDLSLYKESNSPVAIEQITRPHSSTMVVIQEFSPFLRCKFRNTETPTGLNELWVKIIQKYGYDIFTIQQPDSNDPAAHREVALQLLTDLESAYGKLKISSTS